MDRREALRLLSNAIAVPALSGYTVEGLLALGRRQHIRSQVAPGVHRFDPQQRAIIGAIAERIMPETDTPGARAAGVPEFIELVVAENFTDQERERFLAGVGEVDARSRKAGGSDFATLPPAEQDRILFQLEAEAAPLMAQKPPEKKPVEPSQKP